MKGYNTGLWDYSDAYILFEGGITVVRQGADAEAIAADRNDKKKYVLRTVHHLLAACTK